MSPCTLLDEHTYSVSAKHACMIKYPVCVYRCLYEHSLYTDTLYVHLFVLYEHIHMLYVHHFVLYEHIYILYAHHLLVD